MSRRTRKWITVGIVVVVVLVIISIVGYLTGTSSENNARRAPYAGTYTNTSGSQPGSVELHKDGTWRYNFAPGTGFAGGGDERGRSGGDILDESWDVVSLRKGCDGKCTAPPTFATFSGDTTLFLPTMAVTYRRAQAVTETGDWFGVVGPGQLVDPKGTVWVRE